jgi:8-oxo-dGTP diphosphatase
MTNIPQFGDLLVDAKNRPGAYAVVKNDSGQILVAVGKARYHLPGGGVDEGEDFKQAVTREILEETGYSVEALREFGRANQFLATEDLGPINKLGVYFVGHVSSVSVPNLSGTDHESKWISAEEFLSSTAHDFHKWAVKKAF